MSTNHKKYTLDGGSSVDVYHVFGKRNYFAKVDLNGYYPEKGKISKNKGRKECIVLVSGKATLWLNGEKLNMKIDENYIVKNNDTYKLHGIGVLVVFVDDGERLNGKTEILPEKIKSK